VTLIHNAVRSRCADRSKNPRGDASASVLLAKPTVDMTTKSFFDRAGQGQPHELLDSQHDKGSGMKRVELISK
jgi:hypothetical protein